MFLDNMIIPADCLKSTDLAIKQAWVPNYVWSSNQPPILGNPLKLFKAQFLYS